MTLSKPEGSPRIFPGAENGVYRLPPNWSAIATPHEIAKGIFVFEVDLARSQNREDLLAALGAAMHFPPWYGHNLDALMDCLGDLGWRPATGYLVLLHHCAAIHHRAEAELRAVLEIFKQAAGEWRARGIPFYCLVGLSMGEMPELSQLPGAPA